MADNDQAEGAAEAADAAAPKGKLKLIIAVVGVLIVLGGGAATWFFLFRHHDEEVHAEAAAAKPPVVAGAVRVSPKAPRLKKPRRRVPTSSAPKTWSRRSRAVRSISIVVSRPPT